MLSVESALHDPKQTLTAGRRTSVLGRTETVAGLSELERLAGFSPNQWLVWSVIRDMIASCVPFPANPDLSERYAGSARSMDPTATSCGGNEHVYTNYRLLSP